MEVPTGTNLATGIESVTNANISVPMTETKEIIVKGGTSAAITFGTWLMAKLAIINGLLQAGALIGSICVSGITCWLLLKKRKRKHGRVDNKKNIR